MKIAVIGSNGLLGQGHMHIIPLTKHQFTVTHFNNKIYTGTVSLDIRDNEQVKNFVDCYKPDAIINTASITNPESCEIDQDNAYKTNVQGAINLAKACNKAGIYFLLVSTDYVFDGINGPYSETDKPSPISFYGKTKLDAEQAILEINSNFCVARTAMLYGWSKARSNLAYELILNLRNGKKMDVITDQQVSPSYNDNVAEMLVEITERKLNGIYHVAGASILTRYEFACAVAKTFGLDESLISKISMAKFSWKSKRPVKGGLLVDKIQGILTKKPLTVESALARMKREENN